MERGAPKVAVNVAELDAQEFENLILEMAAQARQTHRDSGDPAWDRTAAALNAAWISIQERTSN